MGTSVRFLARNGLDNNAQSITNLGVSGATLTRVGANSLTLTTTATTNVTLPAGSVTLVDLNSAQSLTNKTISGSLTGNASTATTLQTARNFSISNRAFANPVSFNGSGDVVLNVSSLDAGGLQGTIPSVVLGNSTAFVGTTAIALNRASANQALTGISSVALPGATSGTVTLTPAATAGTTAITLPATTGTLITSGDSGTVTSTMIADNTIVNADINAAAGIVDTKLATISTSGKVANTATTATSANTANSIVSRDASGNFSAGTITAALSGNATTATTATNQSGGTVNATTGSFSGEVTGKTSGINTGASFKAITTGGSYSGSYNRSGPFRTDTATTGSSFAPSMHCYYTHNSAYAGIYSLGVLNNSAGDPGAFNILHLNSSDGAQSVWSFSGGSGNFVSPGNVTAYSDARLKKDLEVIPNSLDKIRSLTGYTYTRIDSGERQTGIIAQDVMAVLPEAVIVGKDENETLSVAYGNMIGLLVEAIKELEAKVAKLEGAN